MKSYKIIDELKNKWDVNHDPYLMNDLEKVIKELKALEIIKPYCIVADYKCEDPEDRYELAFCKKICITEKEYNLLKEVL